MASTVWGAFVTQTRVVDALTALEDRVRGVLCLYCAGVCNLKARSVLLAPTFKLECTHSDKSTQVTPMHASAGQRTSTPLLTYMSMQPICL